MSSIIDWIFNRHHNSTSSTVSPADHNDTTQTDTGGNGGLPNGGTPDQPTLLEAEAGAIAGAVFGILLSVAIILAAFYSYRRQKRKNEEYEKEIKTYKMSRHNAGVYMDTTEDSAGLVPGQSPARQKSVYASLRQNPDLYETDSEDEI